MIVQQSLQSPFKTSVLRGRNWRALGGLTFDGTGLFGTGLFCWPPDGVTCSWGIPELFAGLIGVYALYSMFFQTKQSASGFASRRRSSRAAKLRARAKEIEGSTGFGGLF